MELFEMRLGVSAIFSAAEATRIPVINNILMKILLPYIPRFKENVDRLGKMQTVFYYSPILGPRATRGGALLKEFVHGL